MASASSQSSVPSRLALTSCSTSWAVGQNLTGRSCEIEDRPCRRRVAMVFPCPSGRKDEVLRAHEGEREHVSRPSHVRERDVDQSKLSNDFPGTGEPRPPGAKRRLLRPVPAHELDSSIERHAAARVAGGDEAVDGSPRDEEERPGGGPEAPPRRLIRSERRMTSAATPARPTALSPLAQVGPRRTRPRASDAATAADSLTRRAVHAPGRPSRRPSSLHGRLPSRAARLSRLSTLQVAPQPAPPSPSRNSTSSCATGARPSPPSGGALLQSSLSCRTGSELSVGTLPHSRSFVIGHDLARAPSSTSADAER